MQQRKCESKDSAVHGITKGFNLSTNRIVLFRLRKLGNEVSDPEQIFFPYEFRWERQSSRYFA